MTKRLDYNRVMDDIRDAVQEYAIQEHTLRMKGKDADADIAAGKTDALSLLMITLSSEAMD